MSITFKYFSRTCPVYLFLMGLMCIVFVNEQKVHLPLVHPPLIFMSNTDIQSYFFLLAYYWHLFYCNYWWIKVLVLCFSQEKNVLVVKELNWTIFIRWKLHSYYSGHYKFYEHINFIVFKMNKIVKLTNFNTL